MDGNKAFVQWQKHFYKLDVMLSHQAIEAVLISVDYF